MLNNNFLTEQFAAGCAEAAVFSGVIEGGLCWNVLSKERMKDPKSLEPYGYKVFSQNEEDGIIQEIFRRIGVKNKKFIEFGVQNGLESNCHLLLYYGWNGLWIEGSENFCREISLKFRPVIENGQLKVKNAFITAENINELFIENGFTGEIDLLSIDIDGNDFYVWEAVSAVNPRIVIIEYNAKFPPDIEWKQAYNPEHIWGEDDWHGASLKALEKLAEKKGYQLAGTDLRGCNAFFVRKDIAKDLFYEPASAEALYNPLRLNLKFESNHPSKYCLAVQKDNLGILNYQDYEPFKGFHAIETEGSLQHVWMSEKTAVLKILLKKNIRAVNIPYRLPDEVQQHFKNYKADIECSYSGVKNITFKKTKEGGIFQIQLEPADKEKAVSFKVSASELWKPAELMHQPDSRLLGIDILISEISMQ